MPKVNSKNSKGGGKRGKAAPADTQYYGDGAQISSVIFGLVMVFAIIVAGAALLGGSLSQVGKRWGSAMDGVSRTIGLSVDSVEVVGLEHIPTVSRAVQSAAMIAPGENMFRADPHLIQGRVEDTNMVTNVRVYRLWPDTVIIYADAAQPSALWFDGEDWAVVDSLGRQMVGQRPSDHVDLLKSVGTGAPEAVPGLLQALKQMPDLAEKVHVAQRVASRRWDLQLKSGALIRLPADESLAVGVASLARFEADGDLLRRSIEAIDLRVPGRIFLRAGGIQPSILDEEAA